MQFKLPTHKKNSHKGQVGKVLIVGGSEQYYGAPILAALGAENSGADLITLFLPSEHIQAAKTYSLNLFIRELKKPFLSEKDVAPILKETAESHSLLIGNGVGKRKETKAAIIKILAGSKIPTVIDAEALLPEILAVNSRGRNFILTPHQKEFERVFGCAATPENAKRQAVQHSLTILLKGPVDIITSPDGDLYENKEGCPEMRVGGTGDALAGIVASFISQGMDPYAACCSAAYHFGKCGSVLAKKHRWLSAYKIISHLNVQGSLIKTSRRLLSPKFG